MCVISLGESRGIFFARLFALIVISAQLVMLLGKYYYD